MELTTILSIAIPVISGMAYLSGWYLGKAAGIKMCKSAKKEVEVFMDGYAKGKLTAANELNAFAIECKKKYEAGGNL